METVGLFEAKTKLSELIDRVESGEELLITRHGVPVARLVPAGRATQADVAEAVARWTQLRQGMLLNPPGADRLIVKELIEAGRK